MKSVLIGFLVFVLGIALYWIGGGELFERGADTAFALVVSAYFGGTAWWLASW